MGVLHDLILAITLSVTVRSFPFGPPNTDYVCREMFPAGHGVNAQFTDPPFKIILSQNMYGMWEEIEVTVQGPRGTFMLGLFIQARRAGNCDSDKQKEPLGTFILRPGEKHLQTMSCNNRLNSSLSHSSRTALYRATFKWLAPAHSVGPVYFVATVVEKKTKFWTTVYSEVIRDVTSPSAQPVVCPARMYLESEPESTTGSVTIPPKGSDGFNQTGVSYERSKYGFKLTVAFLQVSFMNTTV